MNQNRYSKIFTKKKVASSAVCVVLAVSLFAGCAHFESIEYSQEISEENPETIEAFDQFINDIFETEVTKKTKKQRNTNKKCTTNCTWICAF